MDSEKLIVGKCPLCGGDVIKTFKGWTCVNALAENPTCQFFLFSTIGNRRISDKEASLFLQDKKILLDGFSTKEGKIFTSILSFNPDGTVGMNSQLGKCPKCGGILYVNNRSVSCGNFKNHENPCNFTIWRNTSGHDFSLSQLMEIVLTGATSDVVALYDNKGNKSQHRMGLNENKELVSL